jgi:hypothetical protein
MPSSACTVIATFTAQTHPGAYLSPGTAISGGTSGVYVH